MTKYKQMVERMMSEQKELFDNFSDIHREYTLNPKEWQKLFNQYGGEVMDSIRDYDRKLCAQMGKGQYSKFSEQLSEKFWAEVRKIFPKIDFVGVKDITL